MSKERYTIPDALRGFSLVSMIIYHAIWDLIYIFGISVPWYTSQGAYVWQQSICWTFIILSGFCWHFGRHKLKRGLIVMGCSAVISIVTLLIMPENAVRFGVLSLISAGTLLLIPLDKLLSKVNPTAGLFVSFLCFFLTRNVYYGYIGFESLDLIKLPTFLYRNSFTAWLGFPGADFNSTDYFPILPWIFLYIFGYFLYRLMKEKNMLPYLSVVSIPPLELIGRHSLIIYMLHQPVIYIILQIVFMFV